MNANDPNMTHMKTIYLVRHGETKANREEIFRGRNEIPLGENGREQARTLVKYFEEIAIDKVYSSPLTRAMQTAAIGFPAEEILPSEGINNLDLGSWTGVKKEEIREKDPVSWQLWASEPEKLHFPGGETLGDVYARVSGFLRELDKESFEKAVVVTHRSVIKVLLAAAIGLRTNYYWRFHIDNASVSTLILDPSRGYTLVGLNDTRHLKDFVVEWY